MVLIAIFMVMSLSIVPWEACPLKLIIFRFCMVLSPPVGICACWNLPACARFCPLALGSACCCWVLPAVAAFCLLLPAAAFCLLLPAAWHTGTSCEMQVGDERITLYNQAAQSTQAVVGEHARNASPETLRRRQKQNNVTQDCNPFKGARTYKLPWPLSV